MKYTMAAAALMLAMAGPVLADATKTATDTTAVGVDGTYYTSTEQDDFFASKLIGARVYSTEAAIDTSKPVDKVGADWKDIGEINNIVVGKDGTVKAVVLGVGGFLGIGEKDVAVAMKSLRFLKKSGDNAADWFVVVNADKASLEKAPAYKM